jgi:demethylmenaquinone methyltransferase/2-methoxy-6-polyprenyl-1,4-benzoquinol methylase
MDMDEQLRRVMLRYYDARAPDYEEAYQLGTGTSSISDPEVFQREAGDLAETVRRFAHGKVLDLACGTGYWLQFYAEQCSGVTMVDQSENMLAECRKKIDRFGLADRSTVVRDDVLAWNCTDPSHDCAIVGFLLSHLTDEQAPRLFDALRSALGPGGRFLIMDSAWTDMRSQFNAKIERQERRLNDGTALDIYKRYFDRSDISAWSSKYQVSTTIEYFGDAFLAVSGQLMSRYPDVPMTR